MSEVKVNKISPRTNCGTVQLGDSGDTITIPAGATITNNGTAAGFGATGAASWDTTVKTSGFTAVSGVGYFVNTTAGAITVTLPASPSAGDVVAVSDYAGTADTNNITIGRNGSNINGAAADLTVSNENSAVTLVYVDGTQGWKATDTSSLNDIELQPTYITATGGTITLSGDYKIHTFTGPGTFCVSALGNPSGGPNNVDYLVVAGGGGGGNGKAGGGGAGGFRESHCAANSGPYTASPLATPTSIPLAVQGYPITVGAGGAGTPAPTTPGSSPNATPGANSVFSSIISTGGGGGGSVDPATKNGLPGGSGGGASQYAGAGTGGSGNTPPVSPPQGNNGGNGFEPGSGGGGGGATSVGTNATPAPGGALAGDGGNGAGTAINTSTGTPGPSGSLKYYGGGGGASGDANNTPQPAVQGTGGYGGGGCGQSTSLPRPSCVTGTANTGGGGGASSGPGGGPHTQVGGTGGSGIVIIRYKFQ